MLVLSRKPGERITIGGDITVTVLEITGKLVRIGVDAPRDIIVHRAEVMEQIVRENVRAAGNSGYLNRLREFRSLLGNRKRNGQ